MSNDPKSCFQRANGSPPTSAARIRGALAAREFGEAVAFGSSKS